MSYFDQYSGLVSEAATANGVPNYIGLGLVQTESGFNPNATPGTSSAYGLTQLLKGTAAQLGVNQYDPTQNAYGGMRYLASMPGSNWFDKLQHYYSGPGKVTQNGINYAQKVMRNAENILKGGIVGAIGGSKVANTIFGTAKVAGETALALQTGGASLGTTGIPGMGSGSSWFDELKNWITNSGFFQRIALALVALILILGAVYTLKGKQI